MGKIFSVLSAAGNDNERDRDDKIIFTIKDTKLYVSVVTLSARGNPKLSELFTKGFKDQFIGMNIKQKLRLKLQQINIDIFSNQIF